MSLLLSGFTHDFESGRLDGWTAEGLAFPRSPRRFVRGRPTRGFEGEYYAASEPNSTGTLRSPALDPSEVGGGAATGNGDETLREACLPIPAGAGPHSLVMFAAGASKRLMVDEIGCFARGLPIACAGSVEVTLPNP